MAVPPHALPKLQIEAVLTVPPLKVTDPRGVRQVLASDPIINPKPLGGCYQILLYYKKLKEEHSGAVFAGWAVESLGRALLEHPLLAGRLRRSEDGWEIVSNDSGIRMVEARFPLSLSEFLGLAEKDDLEGDLVFWKEVDEENPEFSPLFYVQVTSFEFGGYSIGISCSLLLAEVLMVENFLKKWADIHSNILAQNEENTTPIFYHPRLKNPESPPPDITSRNPTKNGVRSMVFKVNKELWRESALLCVEEAEQKLDINMGSEFLLLVKESSEVIKVESCSKSGKSTQQSGLKNQIASTTWDEFGGYEVSFHGGNKPVLVSRWVGPVSDGHIMAVPYLKDGVSAVIIVSVPVGKTVAPN